MLFILKQILKNTENLIDADVSPESPRAVGVNCEVLSGAILSEVAAPILKQRNKTSFSPLPAVCCIKT